jgi:hypothetical protein
MRLYKRLILAWTWALLLAACGGTETSGSVQVGGNCSLNAECSSGLLCMQSKCAALGTQQNCTPGKTRCNSGEVELCDEQGRGYEFKERCQGSCGNGACIPQVCAPNSTRCRADNKTVEACLPDGSGYAVVQTCDLACASGVCASSGATICTAGEKRCNNDALEACTPSASGWGFLQFCVTGCDGAAKACKPPVCIPYSERCNPVSGVHEICNSSGTALTAAPCTSSEACVAGRCVPTVCTPGQTRCLDSITVGACNAAGTAYTPSACAMNQSCQAGSCASIVCAPQSTRCKDPSTSQVCAPSGTGYVDVPCQTGFACQAGVCTPNTGTNTCTANSKRCVDALTLATCNPGGTGFDYAACATGETCVGTACARIVCTPGSSRCGSTSSSEVCDPSGTRYNAVSCGAGTACDPASGACKPQVCTTGENRCLDSATVGTCNTAGTGYTPAGCGAGKACASGSCQEVVCSPGSVSCSDGNTVALCNASGTGSTSVNCAAQGKVCVAGVCQLSGGVVCVHGTRRCNGLDVQECKADGSGYTYVQSCTMTCGNGACGGPGCKEFTLTVAGAPMPADNNSTVLITSSVIADSAGVPVPDGTLFTVSATNNTGGVLSTDADPAAAGTQVASVNGKIDFVVKAGPGATAGQTATATATTLTASMCRGSVDFPMAIAGTQFVVSEDFTRALYKDAAGTTAFWELERGQVGFPASSGLGNGEDGDLLVPSGATFNINTQSNPANPSRVFPDAVSLPVTAFSPDNLSVTLSDLPIGFAPGDEVLLINQQGGSGFPSPIGVVSPNVGDTGNVGTYEILSIQSVDVSNNRLTFRSPILKIYGATNSNATLTGQKILVQRIPHYRNVTVNGTLTANAWNGTVGGLLFIKARGAMYVTSSGVVTMAERGYRSHGGTLGWSVGESYPGLGARNNVCGPNNGGGGPSSTSGTCYYSTGGSYGTHGKAGSYGAQSIPFTYGDALLTRWFMGSAGGNYGNNSPTFAGGILVLWADTLGVVGKVSADGGTSVDYSGGSSGGSVYLRANTMAIGQNRVTAHGGTSGYSGTGAYSSGGVGRIRIDAKSLSAGNTTLPAFTLGTAASTSVGVQTSALDNVSGTITRARVASVLQDTRGGTVKYELSSNGGTNWKVFTPSDPLQSLDTPGSDLRLRVTLTENGSNQPLSVQGVTVEAVVGP